MLKLNFSFEIVFRSCVPNCLYWILDIFGIWSVVSIPTTRSIADVNFLSSRVLVESTNCLLNSLACPKSTRWSWFRTCNLWQDPSRRLRLLESYSLLLCDRSNRSCIVVEVCYRKDCKICRNPRRFFSKVQSSSSGEAGGNNALLRWTISTSIGDNRYSHSAVSL